MKHTKEPWHYEINGFSRAILLGDKLTSIGYISNIVNTERIVACVNACAGITNEALEAKILDDGIALVLNAGKDIGVEWKGESPYYDGVKVWEDV